MPKNEHSQLRAELRAHNTPETFGVCQSVRLFMWSGYGYWVEAAPPYRRCVCVKRRPSSKSNLCTNELKRTYTITRTHTHTNHPATHKKIYSQFGWLNHRDFVFDFLLIRHFWVFNRIPENGDKVVFIIELRNDNHSRQWIGVVIRNSVHFFSRSRAPHTMYIQKHTHTHRNRRPYREKKLSYFIFWAKCTQPNYPFRKLFNLFGLTAKKTLSSSHFNAWHEIGYKFCFLFETT